MGLLPQLRPSAFKVVSHDSPQHDQQPLKRSSFNASKNKKNNNNQQLSAEAQQLKAAIIAAHADKPQFVRFSFSRMRHKVTPPVEIPENVSNARALRARVAGRKVPFTRTMHSNTARKAKKRHMSIIDEYVQY